MIPDIIKEYHAIHHDRPYPCGYCYCYSKELKCEPYGNAKLVRERFVNEREPDNNKCGAGLTRPTEVGDCSGFVPLVPTVRPECEPSVLRFYESQYLMEVLTKVYSHPGISRSAVIERKRSGYHTRDKRIDELIRQNLIEDDKDRLYCTYYGDQVAYAIGQMYSEAIRIYQEGDILDEEVAFEILDYVKKNPRCTYRDICEWFSVKVKENDTRLSEKEADMTFYQLLEMGYIKGNFDTYDWETVLYSISERGERQWSKHSAKHI